MNYYSRSFSEDVNNIMMNFSVAANLIATGIMIAVLIRSAKHYQKHNLTRKLFSGFAGTALAIAVSEFLNGIIDVKGFGYIPVFMTTGADRVLYFLSAVFLVAPLLLTTWLFFLWLVYACYRLYHSRDFLKRRFWFGVSPLIIATIVAAARLLHALFFGTEGFLFLIPIVILLMMQLFYLVVSVVMLYRYKKQNGYWRFFNIKAFYIPVIAGMLIDTFFGQRFWGFFDALGILLLFLSVLKEEQYTDEETGFYNAHYIDYIRMLMTKKRYAPRSALIFDIQEAGTVSAVSDMLKKLLPGGSEPIRNQENEVVVLGEIQDRTLFDMMMDDLRDLFPVEGSYLMKRKDETPEAFLERVFDSAK